MDIITRNRYTYYLQSSDITLYNLWIILSEYIKMYNRLKEEKYYYVRDVDYILKLYFDIIQLSI